MALQRRQQQQQLIFKLEYLLYRILKSSLNSRSKVKLSKTVILWSSIIPCAET
ncbi:hypothetical protein PP707_02720 [Acetobacter pasteurianus]|nr:hypothetical protein [Acetobacter pasteurianus]